MACMESDVFCEIWALQGHFSPTYVKRGKASAKYVLVPSKVTSVLVCHEDEAVR